MHDTNNGANGSGQKKARRASTSKGLVTDNSPQSASPPSSRMIPTPSTANDVHEIRELGDAQLKAEDMDLKRPMSYTDNRPSKRMRMDHNLAGIP